MIWLFIKEEERNNKHTPVVIFAQLGTQVALILPSNRNNNPKLATLRASKAVWGMFAGSVHVLSILSAIRCHPDDKHN